MAHSQHGAYTIIRKFEKLNYKTTFRVLDAVNFGAPQRRKRVFFVGCKDERIHLDPKPTYYSGKQQTLDGQLLLPPRTVRDAFTNPPLDGLPNHLKRQHGERVHKRYKSLRPGERDKIDHTDRLEWDKPSGTLLVGSSAGGGRPHIHPEEPRVITVREGARLQTFSDTWVFAGTVTDQYRLVGNAVPVVLARAVGEFLLDHLA
jgi:DNA (cytosine-5)-methyltransferase 1